MRYSVRLSALPVGQAGIRSLKIVDNQCISSALDVTQLTIGHFLDSPGRGTSRAACYQLAILKNPFIDQHKLTSCIPGLLPLQGKTGEGVKEAWIGIMKDLPHCTCFLSESLCFGVLVARKFYNFTQTKTNNMNKHITSTVFSLVLLLIFLTGCLHEPEHKPLKIAVSKAGPGSHYENYANWLHIVDSTIQIQNMYTIHIDSALELLESSDGLLLTGGPDIYPAWYGQTEDTALCGSFDRRRDTLEMSLITKALAMKIPILGICRGEQILNVYFDGSLIVDIPTDYDTTVKHRIAKDPYSCYHKVVIDSNSKLFQTSNARMGFVASNHHQAISHLGEGLKIVARATDSLPEAIEWEEALNRPFMMAVQWHPERMDKSNPLSLPIALYFINAMEEKRMKSETK